MGRLIELMILCAFVALTHLMPRLRKYSAAASWSLPSPLANLTSGEYSPPLLHQHT
jgi:hypothetical protein